MFNGNYLGSGCVDYEEIKNFKSVVGFGSVLVLGVLSTPTLPLKK